jgi:gas vesicle protein
MVKSLLKFLDKFKAIIGYVSAFAGLVGIVIGAYAYLEGIPKRAEKSNVKTQEVVKAYADTTFFLINRVESAIYAQGKRIDNVSEQQNVLKRIVTTEAAKTMTPEQVLKMMEQFDIKKNGNYLFPIVLKRDTSSIQ